MLKSESLPSAFVYVEKGSSIFYHYIKSSNQPLDSPKLLGTIIITHKLEVQMFISSALLPRSSYNPQLYSASIIKTTTEFWICCPVCKSACDWSSEFTASTCIALVISLPIHYVTACTLDGQPDENMEWWKESNIVLMFLLWKPTIAYATCKMFSLFGFYCTYNISMR